MIRIDRQRTADDLLPAINRVFELSAQKIRSIEGSWRPEDGSPVFTVAGVYTSRGWTEWTQGFQFGAPLLQFDATCEREFLELGRTRTLERMAPHLTHTGVHDHGFNNVSTYGQLWRLAGGPTLAAVGGGGVGPALRRAGAEGQRRRPGAALDEAGRRRVHLLLQRRALAVRGHDPLAALARPRAPARAPPDGGAGRQRQPARSAARSRAHHRAVQHLLRPRPRRLRRARAHG